MLKEIISLIVLLVFQIDKHLLIIQIAQKVPSLDKFVLSSECGEYNSTNDSYCCMIY